MNPHTTGPGMFALVKDMNTAFGNPEGDPANIDMDALLMQARSIGSEFVELMNALGFEVKMEITRNPDVGVAVDMDEVRDALCDILVFDLGAFHRMGVNAELDMQSVVGAVMTRFCKDESELIATRAKYDKAGVEYTVHGEFPRVFLRSARDQQMPEFPKGKFLKSAGYKTAKFYALPHTPTPANHGPSGPQSAPSPERNFIGVQQMANQREAVMKLEKDWFRWQLEAIDAFKDELAKCSDAQRRALLSGDFVLNHVIKRKEG